MRMKDSTDNPHIVGTSSDQKRSVFERLGGQLDKSDPMKRKPSPGKHGEYMQPPPHALHEPGFSRFGMESPSQAEMNWRFQNDRRYMSPMFPRDRHPMQLGHPPLQPPPPPMPHYEMEVVGRGQHPYYMHSIPPYHNGPPGPSHPGMGPGNMPMSIHQQRSSPKYDRNGNPIVVMKDRADSSRMRHIDSHHRGSSPPGHFMHGMMMQPGIQPLVHPDMQTMRSRQIFPPYDHARWNEGGMDTEFLPYVASTRMQPEDRFSPPNSRGYPQPPLMSPPQSQIPHPQGQPINQMPCEFPRYARWRERRDVITSLDIETAQSSSRTDSLRSSLQHQDMILAEKRENKTPRKDGGNKTSMEKVSKEMNSRSTEVISMDDKSAKDTQRSITSSKTDNQDISDGEIVGDEDSSDESEMTRASEKAPHYMNGNYTSHPKIMPVPGTYPRSMETHQYYEAGKKRRLHERDDYSLDYETISDDDLDIYMGDKKELIVDHDESKNRTTKDGDQGAKVSSCQEIELLDALGLDWANLVEMAKQSRNLNRAITVTPGAALKRFSPQNYIPTLCIDPKLAGSELYELILNTCRT